MKEITVKTGQDSYKIQIGNRLLLDNPELDKMLGDRKSALILSNYLYDLHWEYLMEVIARQRGTNLFLMQDTEENKNYSHAEKFLQGFVEKGLTRKSAVWAIGGGVVGDFAGYCASLYMRGIPIVQVPSTLLAMVDSSIGGKVAVNLNVGKNIVGHFHQPSLVISDTFFLSTLPLREMKCGLAEILKHGLIGDQGTLDILQKHTLQSVQDESVLSELIYLSAAFKASIVEQDEKEGGLRAILNYGHTAGHAIESLLEYRGISHGEAVALGILVASRLSMETGLLSREGLDYIEDMLKRYELVNSEISCDPKELMEHMKYDKKNSGDSVRFVLLKNPGEPVYDQTVDAGLLSSVLEKTLK